MIASRVVLDSVVRYPVKGLAGVPSDGPVRLEPGSGLRWDRSLAIARDAPAPDATGWRPREEFFHLARDGGIARISVALSDAETSTPRLTLTTPEGATGTGILTTPALHAAGIPSALASINTLLRDVLADEHADPRLVAADAPGLWDWPRAHLSIINLATLEALGREAGDTVDRRRFRGNLYVSGLEPFEEFSLIGSRIRIGDVELEVFQPTDRCRATTIRPGDGDSDLNVPGLLASRYGHMFCGVYARVARGGTLRAGDPVHDTGRGISPAPEGKPGWPRTAHIVERQEESGDVVSLWLSDPFGMLDASAPGAHVRVHLATEPAPNWRSYTISATAPGRFRISVKRDGRVSALLHDSHPVGADVLVTGPHGGWEDDGSRDLLLVSAGIGITPTAALARSRATNAESGRVRVVHTERTASSAPLWAEVCRDVAAIPDGAAFLHLTRDDLPVNSAGFRAVAGRPDAASIAAAAADLDLDRADAFVCGPGDFVSHVRDVLVELGFAAENIRFDAFTSPASLDWGPPRAPHAEDPLPVQSAAGSFVWDPAAGTLLDAAERAGLDWPSECRVGVCGTCARTVAHGDVEYLTDPLFDPGPGRVLVCSAAPLTPLCLDDTLMASPADPPGAS